MKKLDDFQLTLQVCYMLLGLSSLLFSVATIIKVIITYIDNIGRYSLPKELAVICAISCLGVIGLWRMIKSIRIIVTNHGI